MTDGSDLADVSGPSLPWRALEIMIAGGHHLLLCGPPSPARIRLTRRLADLLPDLDRDAAIEVTKLHSIAHRQIPGSVITKPPVRMPHHTTSVAGLLGGGNPPRPGETSLAHRGVLVLDDLPQLPRACIEGLQEPLERGVITLVRGRKELQYPARFQLMAFMSLCPCGFLGHPDHVCVDNLAAVQRHQARVFGPLSDYFDLVVRLPPSTADAANEPGRTAVLERILAARARQHARLRKTPWPNNAALPAEEIERMCQTTRDARKLLHDLVKRDKIDERAVVHLLRVAQTVQDLDPGISKKIGTEAIAMAVRLRRLPAIGTK